MESLEVVVVGAGIGGLSAAVALGRDGHRVHVVDRVRELRPVGAGISLWSNGVKVLNAVGLGPALAAVGGHMVHVDYRRADGSALCDFSLDPLVSRVGQRPYPVRRSDLQQLLLEAIGPGTVSLGVRCTGLADDGERVVVSFDDAPDVCADVVVAADGTHSQLRAHVIGHPVAREYVGYHNWNGIVRTGLGGPDSWTMYLGESKRVSTMPVRDGHYFFFDVPLPGAEDDADREPRELLREHFASWAPEVRDLIERLDARTVSHVAIHTHEPIRRFTRGRVAILGDAAHTTAPDLGQGGCQAMEDALVLAHFLRTTNVGVEDALARYDSERVPRTEDVVVRARRRAELSHGHDPERTAEWYRELAVSDGSDIIDGICRTIEGGPCR